MASRDTINAAMRLARQTGGAASEPRSAAYEEIMEKARALNSRMAMPEDVPGEPQTRRERAEATARRVMDQPGDEFAMEAGPGLVGAALGSPKIGKAIGKTLPYLATAGGIGSIALPASAGELGGWVPPTPEQKKNPAWVEIQQQRRLARLQVVQLDVHAADLADEFLALFVGVADGDVFD